MQLWQPLAEHFIEWRRLLGANNFGWLWVGQVLSQIGDGVSKVALLFFVYDHYCLAKVAAFAARSENDDRPCIADE